MGRVFRPWYRSRKTGERVTVSAWYAEWTDAAGKTRRKKVGARRLAEAFLAQRQDEVDRQRAGLAAAPTGAARARALDDWRDEYLGLLAAKGNDETYRKTARARIDRVLRDCGWLLWPDVAPDPLVRLLGAIRESGRSPATCNGYLRDVKGFAKWVAERLGVLSPLRGVKPMNEEVDRRRSLAILTDTELAALVAAAEHGPEYDGITGPARALLYRVAAYTGLRSSELASLTPAQFDLAGDPPAVTVAAKSQKARRPDAVPLPGHLVKLLRKAFKGRDSTAPIWPGPWAKSKRQAKWFTRDKAAAGITSLTTFHGLRRGYITRLIRAGIDADLVRRLARHRDLKTTMAHYASAELSDLAAAAESLKPLKRPRGKP